MSEDKKAFDGIFIDITTNEDGNLEFSAGYDFAEKTDPTYEEYMKDLLAGLYACMVLDIDAVVSAGATMRESDTFKETLEKLNRPSQDAEYEGNGVLIYPDTDAIH